MFVHMWHVQVCVLVCIVCLLVYIMYVYMCRCTSLCEHVFYSRLLLWYIIVSQDSHVEIIAIRKKKEEEKKRKEELVRDN